LEVLAGVVNARYRFRPISDTQEGEMEQSSTQVVATEHDQVWGAGQIAKVINRSTRVTFYLLETGKLPARKIGGRWTASRARLKEHLVGETA
jgi:hypothetical protein